MIEGRGWGGRGRKERDGQGGEGGWKGEGREWEGVKVRMGREGKGRGKKRRGKGGRRDGGKKGERDGVEEAEGWRVLTVSCQVSYACLCPLILTFKGASSSTNLEFPLTVLVRVLKL
jgi:hypothetical protein